MKHKKFLHWKYQIRVKEEKKTKPKDNNSWISGSVICSPPTKSLKAIGVGLHNVSELDFIGGSSLKCKTLGQVNIGTFVQRAECVWIKVTPFDLVLIAARREAPFKTMQGVFGHRILYLFCCLWKVTMNIILKKKNQDNISRWC